MPQGLQKVLTAQVIRKRKKTELGYPSIFILFLEAFGDWKTALMRDFIEDVIYE